MKGVILAAGKGTRMLPLTERRPKPLVPVVDCPMIEHILGGFRDAGVRDILVVIGHLGKVIQEHLGDGSKWGVHLRYTWQDQPPGTGAGTLLAREFVGADDFLLSWGDILVGPETYANLARIWAEERPPAILSLNWVDDPWEGAAVYVHEGRVERIEEKPPRGTAATHYNNAGVFVFSPLVFDYLEKLPLSPRGEIEMPDAIAAMMGDDLAIRGEPVLGYWSDLARPSSVLALNAIIIAHRDASQVIVAPQARVHERARLQGPVYVGPGCVVGESTVGPNVVLLENVVVEAGAVLSDMMAFGHNRLAAGSTVSHALLEEGVVVEAGQQTCGEKKSPAVLRQP